MLDCLDLCYDLPTDVDKNVVQIPFPDDSMLYIQAVHRRASAVKDDLQLDVNNVGRWFKDNRLTANVHNVAQ